MHMVPLQNECQSTPRKLTLHDTIFNSYGNFEFTISCMKMRGLMIPVQYGDYDSKKAADLRHGNILSPQWLNLCNV